MEKRLNKMENDCNYDILIEQGWFYVPEYIDKKFKPNTKILENLIWREFSIHPPLELLN